MSSQTNSSYLVQPETSAQDITHDNYQAYCQPITATALLPSIFIIIQCALLHPTLAHSRSAKLLRISLTPVNFYWWIRLPFQQCFRPLETFGMFNMGLATVSITMAIKSLEWGFATGSYYKRPLIDVDGVSRWEKVKETDDSYKKLQEDEACNAFNLITWTALQITSSVNSFWHQLRWWPVFILWHFGKNNNIVDSEVINSHGAQLRLPRSKAPLSYCGRCWVWTFKSPSPLPPLSSFAILLCTPRSPHSSLWEFMIFQGYSTWPIVSTPSALVFG